MVRRRLPNSAKRGSRHVKCGSGRKNNNKTRSKIILASLTSLSSALRFVLVVFVLATVFVGWSIYTHRVWKGSERITFVLQELEPSASDSGVYVVSYLTSDDALAVVSFPEGMKIEAIGGYGPWRVESLYPLGEMEGKGGELLAQSLAEFFGIKIDGWLVVDSLGSEIDENKARTTLRRMIGKTLVSRGKTNLGIWDLFALWRAIGVVRINDVEWVNFSQAGAVSEELQPDGTKMFIANLELVNDLSQRLFSQPELMEEGLAITVLNATSHRGLGASVARRIRNMGGEVVSVSDAHRSQKVTKLLVSQEKLLESFSVKLLSDTFLIDEVSGGETSQQRADVLIVVGEDYWTRLMSL
jgi:hypothetical protein